MVTAGSCYFLPQFMKSVISFYIYIYLCYTNIIKYTNMCSAADLLCAQLPIQAAGMFHVKGLQSQAVG